MHIVWTVSGSPSSSPFARQRKVSKHPRPLAFGGFSKIFRVPLICDCHPSIGRRSTLPLQSGKPQPSISRVLTTYAARFFFANRGNASSRTLRPQDEHLLRMTSPGAPGTLNSRITCLRLRIINLVYSDATLSPNSPIIQVSIHPDWSVCSSQRSSRKHRSSSSRLSIAWSSVLRPSWAWSQPISSVGRSNQAESATAGFSRPPKL